MITVVSAVAFFSAAVTARWMALPSLPASVPSPLVACAGLIASALLVYLVPAAVLLSDPDFAVSLSVAEPGSTVAGRSVMS